MTKRNIGVLLVLVLLFPACGPLFEVFPACAPVKEGDLYGTYIANYPFGAEKLTLNANGSYKQEVTINGDPKTLEHEGHWDFDATDNYVVLENGLAVQSDSGELEKDYNVPVDGLLLCKVARSFLMGRIKLAGATEETYFTKIQ